MPLYLLDTDTVSLYRAGHPEVTRRVGTPPRPDVAVTAVTVEEQLAGWFAFLRKATRPADIERAYGELAATVTEVARFPIRGFPQSAIARSADLVRQKLNVGKNDLRIAAIALELGATVVTRNLRDFGRVPGLPCEDWSAPTQ